GEQDGAAADDVDEEEHLVPGDPIPDEGSGLADHHGGDVGDYLEWDHDHQHLLLALLEEGLEEGPAGADEDDHGEQEDAFQELEDVE
ncbi:unnamed protein product, partial [Musa acuminata var. zebrina]